MINYVYSSSRDSQIERCIALIFYPVKACYQLNKLLLDMLWGELMQRQRQTEPLVVAGGLAFFFIGSLYCYHYDDVFDWAVLLLTLMIVLDKFVLRKAEKFFREEVSASFEEVEGGMFCFKTSRGMERYFRRDQLSRLHLRPMLEFKGFVHSDEQQSWDLQLLFSGDELEPLLLFEAESLEEAVLQARSLGSALDLEWRIQGEVAVTPVSAVLPKFSRQLHVEQQADSLTIQPRMTMKRLLQLLKSVGNEAGYLLFMVIVASFTKRLGYLLNGFYGPSFGFERGGPQVYEMDSIFYFFRAFFPEFEVFDTIEIVIALVVIILYLRENLRARVVEYSDELWRYAVAGEQKISSGSLEVRVVDDGEVLLLLQSADSVAAIKTFADREDAVRLAGLLQNGLPQ